MKPILNWHLLCFFTMTGCITAPAATPIQIHTSPIITPPILNQPQTPTPWPVTVKSKLMMPMSVTTSVATVPPTLSKTPLRHLPAVPGGIAYLILSTQGPIPPEIIYNQQRVIVLQDPPHWVAIIGIPLTVKSGKHFVIDKKTGEHYPFEVVNKKYQTQHLKIQNERQVNPTAQDMKRIQREAAMIKQVLATPWRATSTSPLPLLQPVQGRLSSTFGVSRYINGQARNPHKGIDIAASLGTPVAAAGDGIVVNTGNYFFTGNTIFIDHGQGVVTMYCHLDHLAVTLEQTVNQGQTIGTVGKTGRATGPHLHWSVNLNNAMVDPMLVIAE